MRALALVVLLSATPVRAAEPGPATWLRLGEPAPYAGVLVDRLDIATLWAAVDDLDECQRGRQADAAEADSRARAAADAATIALAEARLQAQHADERADAIEAAGRRAAEAADSAPSWWAVVGGVAVGVLGGLVVGLAL